MDKITPEQRSNNMRAIRSKDSQIELRLRKALWAAGLRYRKHYRRLPGTPDVVLVSDRIAVFCDSDFWHGYDWPAHRYDIKSNRDFWVPKIEANIQRDGKITQQLREMGWTVLRFWGHDIELDLDGCVSSVLETVRKRRSEVL